ncbi:hypothetical protein NECAME_12483 [Necator americanus]|uniref:Uncharacterized protein n=1 Tax=Necator americanus TaxID=51031 RepID=W2T0A8_NECAM|nr:hypothetical protein NECAME_12483 [Necator americanus]ETN75313.1 hypothetical protein NECAME_12483 [Necator americanus]
MILDGPMKGESCVKYIEELRGGSGLRYENQEEAFYMDLKELLREDHTFCKVIISDFNAKHFPEKKA